MWYTAELVLKSYMPISLEKGMWFVNVLYPDTEKEMTIIRELKEIPKNQEEYVQINGYPVHPYIIDPECIYTDERSILAKPEEIDWIDDCEECEDYYSVELKHISRIINEFLGYLEIEISEDELEENEQLLPILYTGQVLIRFPQDDYEDEYFDDEEENELID